MLLLDYHIIGLHGRSCEKCQLRGRLNGKEHNNAADEGDVTRKDSRIVGGGDRVQSVSLV